MKLRSILYLILITAFLFGCTSKRIYSSSVPAENITEIDQDEKKHEEKAKPDSTKTSENKPLLDLLIKKDDKSKSEEKSTPEKNSKNLSETSKDKIANDIFFSTVDIDDSASAVDDDLWRQFDLASEYHGMGVMANREANWEEAQFYFEKSLRILANLDIETDSLHVPDDSTLAPEALKYNSLLENIISDYRVTLRSLGTLTEDVSSAVLLERFSDLAGKLSGDTLVVFKDEFEKTTYDIPIVINDRVKSSIVYFQTVAKSAFSKYLRRSKKYTPMMKRILREYGLPDDLIYLSLIESGYNPHAYSWARAMGLWQFISSTGRAYNLNRSWWVDERKDPIKATHSAAQFLRDLYREFGDWELAMAAYNGGPGRVRRTIKKQNTRDFWKLKLKRQTMDYVPLIMAATIIAKNPEQYGFHDTEFEPEVVWDEVTIDKCLELSVVANKIGCTTKEIKTLNPELLRKYTPPNEKKYILKIPIGTKEKFQQVYSSLPSPKETSWVKHKIRKGEAISTIASKYGVSQYAILEANNLHRRSTIYAGKTIIVPVPLDREYNGSRNKNRVYESSNSIYVVRSGDTMWDIARAFGTTVSSLRQSNYIERGSRIYVGQKMKIPASATKRNDKKNNKAKSTTYASNNKSSSTSSGSSKSYKVKSGDTLWEIARRFGTTTSKLRKLNALGRSSRIYPGQKLTVDGNADYTIHKVRRGETLSSIANRYRTTIARIRAQNNIDNPDRLRIGEKLVIY